MLIIDNKLISDDVLKKHFACNLVACKGQCCVAGEGGAPLEDHELPIIDQVLPTVWPMLTKEGQAAIQKKGTYQWDKKTERNLVTLVGEQGQCAFVTFDNAGIALCGIHKAYLEGKLEWEKPVSCHLYPIRVYKVGQFDALNYDRWEICNPACSHGEKLQIPLYQFVKEPIIRKYGEDFYRQLDAAANDLKDKL